MSNNLIPVILLIICAAAACALLFKMTLKNFETLNNKLTFTILFTILLSPLGAYVFSAVYKYRESSSALRR